MLIYAHPQTVSLGFVLEHADHCATTPIGKRRQTTLRLQWLSMGTKSPTIFPFPGGSRPPSNTWLPGPTPPHLPNSILIGPAVFAEYINVTYIHRQTDRQTTPHHTSVAIGRIYAMRSMRLENVVMGIFLYAYLHLQCQFANRYCFVAVTLCTNCVSYLLIRTTCILISWTFDVIAVKSLLHCEFSVRWSCVVD